MNSDHSLEMHDAIQPGSAPRQPHLEGQHQALAQACVPSAVMRVAPELIASP